MKEDIKTRQKKTGTSEDHQVIPIIDDVLSSDGEPLDTSTREFMESRFGHDFGQVRVHVDANSAQAMNALSFTIGQNLVFDEGQYMPGTTTGKGLLAHELAHVVQQNNDLNEQDTEVSSLRDGLEVEANEASKVIGTKQVAITGKAPYGTVQCQRKGSIETSQGIEEIEGDDITGASAQAIHERLDANKDSVNDRIQEWTKQSVNDLRNGLQDAAISFQNWYQSRSRKPNTAAFVMDVASAALSAIKIFLLPESTALSVLDVVVGLSKSDISRLFEPNAVPDAQVLQIQQGMIHFSSLVGVAFENFGGRLKKENPDIWNSIGVAITSAPPLLEIAKEELYGRAGLFRPGQPYGEQILASMIYAYTDWEKRWVISESTFFISGESIEYALFKEHVQQRLQKEARLAAKQRLGSQEDKK